MKTRTVKGVEFAFSRRCYGTKPYRQYYCYPFVKDEQGMWQEIRTDPYPAINFPRKELEKLADGLKDGTVELWK